MYKKKMLMESFINVKLGLEFNETSVGIFAG